MPERSDPTSNAEIVRNALAPEGFGRRPSLRVGAAAQRYSGIACVAVALHPAWRRSERQSCGLAAAC